MTEQGLWEALRDLLPANRTPLLEKSIRALEELAGINTWKARGPYVEGMIPWEVLWGFPWTFFADAPSLDPLRKAIGARLRSNQEPEHSDLSEVSAAALAKALGARRVQRVAETLTPTPDYRVWWENEQVELEVTRADPKKSRIDGMEAMRRLSDQIQAFGRPCDIVIHVADILREEDRQQILTAARNLESEKEMEVPGRWRVRAERPRRDGNYHVAGNQTDRTPPWWAELEVVRLFGLQQAVGGQQESSPYPQVRIQFGTPVTGYLNSARRKADCFQGTGNVPFVIAVDVMALPGSFDLFSRELPEYFNAWPRVSGVLLIHGPALIWPQVGWMWRLIQNPGCRNKLPDSMIMNMPAQPTTKMKAYNLVEHLTG